MRHQWFDKMTVFNALRMTTNCQSAASLSTFYLCSNFISLSHLWPQMACMWLYGICICLLMSSHTVTHSSCQCVNVTSVCWDTHPCVVRMTLSVTLYSLDCVWDILEVCVQWWKGSWQLMSPFSPATGANHREKIKIKKEKLRPVSWLAHLRLPRTWQVHSHILGKKDTHTPTYTKEYAGRWADIDTERHIV